MTRRAHLSRLRSGTFDVLVIGGGITGAGVALDAASKGMSVALVEKADFAQGTSSASTKLIHGGLRYLPMFDLAQVREGLQEQNRLLQNAPHLVRPLPFVLPLYAGARRPLGLRLPPGLGTALPVGMALGLRVYDLLARRPPARRHRDLTPAAAAALVPALRLDGLRRAYLYYDAITDDARLTLTVIRTAVRLGAVVTNYAEVVGVTTEGGRVTGARIADRLTGQNFTVKAGLTFNATGVWAESIARLVGPPKFRIRQSKGVHLVFPNDSLRMGRTALVLPETDDGRIAFVVPWQGALILGTTDTDWNRADERPEATADDASYLITHASRFLTAPPAAGDALGAFAGLRPLVSSGRMVSRRLSRRHEIVGSAEGFFSVIGGKLTTFRRMAEDAINLATGRAEGTPSRTRDLPLVGAEDLANTLPWLRARARQLGLSRATFAHLIRAYGTGTATVLDRVARHPALRDLLVPGRPHIAAEVVVAAREEMAVTVADVLLRRTRLANLLPRHGTEIAPRVADLMGEELEWTAEMRAAQVADYARDAGALAVAPDTAPTRGAGG